MGGKDTNPALSRGSREASNTSSFHTSSRSSNGAPFYRQFLPTQLSNISAHDSIPSLDELSALAKHLGRIKTESAARLSRLESRSSDPLRPIFFSAPNDLFSPPGLSSASLNLYSDSPRQTPPTPSKHQKTRERSFASPAPSGSSSNLNGSSTGGAHNKVKVKRERDNDSAPAGSSALYADTRSPQKLPGAGGKANPRSKPARGHSLDLGGDDDSIASTDPEWDLDEDSMPSRPGRTYAKNKKRKRKEADADSNDDESGSEFEAGALLGAADSARGASTSKHVGSSATAARSAAGAVAAAGSGSRKASDIGASSGGAATPKIPSMGMRLKANTGTSGAAAQTPPGFPRKASEATQVSTRRNSVLPSPSPLPSTPLAQSTLAVVPPVIYQAAPGWELPARTPATFMPVLEKSRKPRDYPTRPGDVNEDFANKDWKEKERERDRLLERESVGPGTPGGPGGPGPGQSMVKEATTGRRGGRDLQQTPINTFYNYADAFFKTLTEDDLAWLSSKSDDHEPFQMPPLGRHYKEMWDEEDALLASGVVDAYGNPLPPISRSPSISLGGGGLPLDAGVLAAARNGAKDQSKQASRSELEIPPPPHFRVKQMTDQHLGLESPAVVDARSGPLAERLVASLLPSHREGGRDDPSRTVTEMVGEGRSALPASLLAHLNGYPRTEDDEGDDDDADGEADTDAEGVLQDQDMVTFEERITKELKALDVLGADESIDWSSRADDEISTTLRMVQRELARQQKVNEMRKDRLFGIAKDRMAYQDYLNCLNSVEKEIETGWTRRLRQIKASLSKRKKGGHSASSHHDDSGLLQAHGTNGVQSASGTPQPGGMPQNGPVRPQLPDNVVSAMDRRQKLQYAFKELFDEAKHAWQTPTESVYADLHLDQVE